MRYMHTCSISGVYLIVAMVEFPSSKFVHLAGQVISCPRFQVPGSISGIGGRDVPEWQGQLNACLFNSYQCQYGDSVTWLLSTTCVIAESRMSRR
jgi:hypothetical protein